MKNKVGRRYKYIYMGYLAIIFLITVFFLTTKFANDMSAVIVKGAFVLVGIAVNAGICILFKKKPGLATAVLLSALGLCYFCFMPMLQIPDDAGHYLRSLEISYGQFLTPRQGNLGVSCLPGNVYDEAVVPREIGATEHAGYREIYSVEHTLDYDEYQYYVNQTQALYCPVNYLPQAIGCLIGRIFCDNSFVIYYAGRTFGFIVCLILLLLAIKIMPLGKHFLILLAAMPMFLQQLTSLSTDGITNSVAILLVAYIMYVIAKEGQCDRKDIICIFALCLFMSLCKIVYLPLCYLVILIPNRKLKPVWKVSMCLIATVLNIGWLLVGLTYMVEFRAGVDTASQVKFVLSNLFTYIVIFVRTIALKAVNWAGTMVGAKLGTLSIYTNLLLVVLYLFMLLAEMIGCSPDESTVLCKKQRIGMGVFFALTVGLTLSCLYVQWTPVASPVIEGFQGRYLIPVMPLLCLALKGKWGNRIIKLNRFEMYKWQLPLIIATNVCALASVYFYFR